MLKISVNFPMFRQIYQLYEIPCFRPKKMEFLFVLAETEFPILEFLFVSFSYSFTPNSSIRPNYSFSSSSYMRPKLTLSNRHTMNYAWFPCELLHYPIPSCINYGDSFEYSFRCNSHCLCL